ncbi:hypothetical protein GCT13_38370 [Paraburkholderia sp. CNPSo 3157]|uniref:Major facilitator superfamily (MFS) profile domain-containing protein n=1 Tax=Paraburkholderia franconis TaxID=2654983 RepID=A0A7X1TKD7_9BURK|nr:hypothetical protein [Paraburkholderia franconis]MPW22530.1 hypothetical protein [Paraburkholderia franconis]
MFPTDIRSFGTGIAAGLGRAGAIVGIVMFPIMMRAGGLKWAMRMFCADAAIAAMVVFGRETKSAMLE